MYHLGGYTGQYVLFRGLYWTICTIQGVILDNMYYSWGYTGQYVLFRGLYWTICTRFPSVHHQEPLYSQENIAVPLYHIHVKQWHIRFKTIAGLDKIF